MDPRKDVLPANRARQPVFGKPNLCPFGCKKVDEHGYCRHLVGFTLDEKTVELREKIPGHESYERCGILTDTVKADDELVAVGSTPQTTTPTLRVYRKSGNAPVSAEAEKPKKTAATV